MDPFNNNKCCQFLVKERKSRTLTQVRAVQPPKKEDICVSSEEDDKTIQPSMKSFEEPAFERDGEEDDWCDPCEEKLWMSDIEAKVLSELLHALVECEEATFGKVFKDHTSEHGPIGSVTQERERFEWQRKFLEGQLTKAAEEADAACQQVHAMEQELAPDRRRLARQQEALYKHLEKKLRPFKELRRRVHQKANGLTAAINQSTATLYEPLSTAIHALKSKFGPWNPLTGVVSDLALDLLDGVGKRFFIDHAGEVDFAKRVATCMDEDLNSAAWAAFALKEFLAMKGQEFPSAGRRMEDDPHFEGPSPPPCSAVDVEDWRAMRNSFMLMKESKMSRSILRGHGVDPEDAEAILPAFPDKDQARVMMRCVDKKYFCEQASMFRGKWAVSAFSPMKKVL